MRTYFNSLLITLTLALSGCAHNGYLVKFNGVNIEDPTLVDVLEGTVTLTGTAPDKLKPRDYYLLNTCVELGTPCFLETELLWKGYDDDPSHP